MLGNIWEYYALTYDVAFQNLLKVNCTGVFISIFNLEQILIYPSAKTAYFTKYIMEIQTTPLISNVTFLINLNTLLFISRYIYAAVVDKHSND